MNAAILQVNNIQNTQPVKPQETMVNVPQGESFQTALKEADIVSAPQQPQSNGANANNMENPSGVVPNNNLVTEQAENVKPDLSSDILNPVLKNPNDIPADNENFDLQQKMLFEQNQYFDGLKMLDNGIDKQKKDVISAVEKQIVLDKEKFLSDKTVELNLQKKELENTLLNENVLNPKGDEILAFINEQDVEQKTEFLTANLVKSDVLNHNLDASMLELHSKISAINSLDSVSRKAKNMLGSIKMSNEDTAFFINMVENQNNNNFQSNIVLNAHNQVMFSDVAKTQALQSSAAVSQALIDKLQESMNTNKAFRVDFDKDVAVIIKVDQNGTLSANFIPGSSAVEQYLRNNIAELRQTFDSKGLEYNELSYTSKKHSQNKQQNKNQKGDRDE